MHWVGVSNCVIFLLDTLLVRMQIGVIGQFGLFSFIVAWRYGAVGFIFIYFHSFYFDIVLQHCVIVCYIIFWYFCVELFFFFLQ
jgi:hypothetical protein